MRTAILFLLTLASSLLFAQAPTADRSPAHSDACAACHGANGVSVAAGIPHLAGQDRGYLRAQLAAYRDGVRQNPVMAAVTAKLSDAEIDALATFLAGLAGAPDGNARSPLPPALVKADFPFPADHQTRFTRYHTIDRGTQVRNYYANETAVAAARAGRPLSNGSYLLVEISNAVVGDDGQPVRGDDGHFVAGTRVGYTAMAREAGWGDAVPQLLRNEDWLYASFTAEGTVNAGANLAACLACHVPRAEASYTFTLDPLIEFTRRTR